MKRCKGLLYSEVSNRQGGIAGDSKVATSWDIKGAKIYGWIVQVIFKKIYDEFMMKIQLLGIGQNWAMNW